MKTGDSETRLTRRSVLWLGGGTIGAIALAACGQATITEAPAEDVPEEKEAEAKEPEPQAEPVNLDWALWGDSTWVEAAQAGADVYTANNPNVTLKRPRRKGQSGSLHYGLGGRVRTRHCDDVGHESRPSGTGGSAAQHGSLHQARQLPHG